MQVRECELIAETLQCFIVECTNVYQYQLHCTQMQVRECELIAETLQCFIVECTEMLTSTSYTVHKCKCVSVS